MNIALKFIQKHWIIIVIVLFFGTIYSLISIVNHYNFRTSAYDLGIYNQAIWNYSQLKLGPSTVMWTEYKFLLGDHMTLLQFIIAPFRYIMGTYTLLVFQILTILFGGVGMYRMIYFISDNKVLAKLAMIHFLSIWGIYSALSFDYHDNVIGAMLMPWLLFYFFSGKFKLSFLFFALILISKENMSIWLAGVSLGLIVNSLIKKDGKLLKGILMMLISIVYFILLTKIVFPAFQPDGSDYYHFKYSHFGKSIGDVIKYFFLNPRSFFISLFENHTQVKTGYGAKAETLFFILISGGITLFYKPQYLVMILPILLQKFMHDEYSKWGINVHYSIEFVPIIAISAFTFLNDKVKNKRTQISIAILLIIFTMTGTYSSWQKRYSKYWSPKNIRLNSKEHYSREFNVKKAHDELRKYVPHEVKLSAESNLVPHLAFRERIYTFNNIADAEYFVMLKTNHERFPKEEAFNRILNNKIIDNPEWEEVYSGEIIVYKLTKSVNLDVNE